MSGPVGRLSMPGFQFGGSGRQARHSGEDPAGIDLHRDVVLRLELMTSSEVRWSSVISLVISGVIIWSCIALSIVQHEVRGCRGRCRGPAPSPARGRVLGGWERGPMPRQAGPRGWDDTAGPDRACAHLNPTSPGPR